MGLISVFARVPLTVWLCIALAIWGGIGHVRTASLKADIAQYKLAQAETNAESERLARKAESLKNEAARKEQNLYADRIKAVTRDSALQSATVASLLNQLETAKSTAGSADSAAICGVDGRRGEVLERLLAESAKLVGEGGERVRELSAKTASLQGYIDRVCVSK